VKPLPLSDATRRLGAPPDWDHSRDGLCHTLEICDRNGVMILAWQPSAVELALIAQGKPIFLHIWGRAHPVVALTVGGE
jgi:hypothetical protein